MESKKKRRKEKSTWINDCMIKSHTPLQCFSPPSSVPPLISLPLHLLHLYKAECRHHPAHTNTRAHTPPRHLSVQRPVSLALGAVGSKRVKEKKCLSAPSSRIPLPLFVPPRCAVVYQTVSRHHAVRRWGPPLRSRRLRSMPFGEQSNCWNLMSKKRWRICAGVFFSRFARQLRELISAQFINYRVHIFPANVKAYNSARGKINMLD